MDKEAKLLFLQHRAPMLQKWAADMEEEANIDEIEGGRPKKVRATKEDKRKQDIKSGAIGAGLAIPAAVGAGGLAAGAYGGLPVARRGMEEVGRLGKFVAGKLPTPPKPVRATGEYLGRAAKFLGRTGKRGLIAGGAVGAVTGTAVLGLALIMGRQRAQRRAEEAAGVY